MKDPKAGSPPCFTTEAEEEGHRATCLAGGRAGTSTQAP